MSGENSDSCQLNPEKNNGVRDQLREDCFTEEEIEKIRTVVKEKYREVASSADGRFKYITGKPGAMFLGYKKEYYANIPAELMTSFCGVGNPFALQEIEEENSVLDIGCGAGFDLCVARQLTGDRSRVCGVDICEDMVTRAQKNIEKGGWGNIEVRAITSEKLPFADNSFDVVISNGVINLSPNKGELFKEIFRVLKPGGRLQFADIILDKRLPGILVGSMEAWSQ